MLIKYGLENYRMDKYSLEKYSLGNRHRNHFLLHFMSGTPGVLGTGVGSRDAHA